MSKEFNHVFHVMAILRVGEDQESLFKFLFFAFALFFPLLGTGTGFTESWYMGIDSLVQDLRTGFVFVYHGN